MEPTCYNEGIINTGDYMDENLSWRARLAKSNINILSVDQSKWYIEFTYHPRPGTFKWCKTFVEVPFWPYSGEEMADAEEINCDAILKTVLRLRKELEA